MPLNTTRKASPKAKVSGKVDEYIRFRDMILREQLMPNERLVEQDYAERFHTNRSNIRKALTRLEQDGFVVLEPYRGARVRRITPTEAVEMFEVRGALEVMLMQHVGLRITKSDKERLKALAQKVREAAQAKNPVSVGAASRVLREELWQISGHTVATRLLGGLNTLLVRNWYRTSTVPGRADAIAAQLSTVVDLICDDSSSKAALAMRQYHDAAVANLKRALSMGIAASNGQK